MITGQIETSGQLLCIRTQMFTCMWRAGMPPDVNSYDDSLMRRAQALAQQWYDADPGRTGTTPDGVSESDMHGWSVDDKLAFVAKLAQFAASKPLHKDMTRALDKLYHFDAIRNPEVSYDSSETFCEPSVHVL